jgi:hypothetical protein
MHAASNAVAASFSSWHCSRSPRYNWGPIWSGACCWGRWLGAGVLARLARATSSALPSRPACFIAGTGIASHTDYVNFVQTSHLGLDVPEGDCWIKVG